MNAIPYSSVVRNMMLDHLSQGHVLVGHQVSRGITGITSDVTGGEYDHSMICLPLFDTDGEIVDAVMINQATGRGAVENRLSRYLTSGHVERIDWSVLTGLDVSAMIREAAYMRDTPYGFKTIIIHAVYETVRRLIGAERLNQAISATGAEWIVSALTSGTLICSQAVAVILARGGWREMSVLPPWRVTPSRLAIECPYPAFSVEGTR
jgi:hypothetical protein